MLCNDTWSTQNLVVREFADSFLKFHHMLRLFTADIIAEKSIVSPVTWHHEKKRRRRLKRPPESSVSISDINVSFSHLDSVGLGPELSR